MERPRIGYKFYPRDELGNDIVMILSYIGRHFENKQRFISGNRNRAQVTISEVLNPPIPSI